jgi:hypothetical protein
VFKHLTPNCQETCSENDKAFQQDQSQAPGGSEKTNGQSGCEKTIGEKSSGQEGCGEKAGSCEKASR